MNLKLHIIAATFFVMIGMAILITTGKIRFGEPPAGDPSQPVIQSTRFLQIDSASWGLNCKKFATNLPPFKPTKEKPNPPIALRLDNVLRPISSICNGKVACQFMIDNATLGMDPVPSCTKELLVEYRCDDMERVHRKSFFASTKPTVISCLADQPNATAPASGNASQAPAEGDVMKSLPMGN